MHGVTRFSSPEHQLCPRRHRPPCHRWSPRRSRAHCVTRHHSKLAGAWWTSLAATQDTAQQPDSQPVSKPRGVGSGNFRATRRLKVAGLLGHPHAAWCKLTDDIHHPLSSPHPPPPLLLSLPPPAPPCH